LKNLKSNVKRIYEFKIPSYNYIKIQEHINGEIPHNSWQIRPLKMTKLQRATMKRAEKREEKLAYQRQGLRERQKLINTLYAVDFITAPDVD